MPAGDQPCSSSEMSACPQAQAHPFQTDLRTEAGLSSPCCMWQGTCVAEVKCRLLFPHIISLEVYHLVVKTYLLEFSVGRGRHRHTLQGNTRRARGPAPGVPRPALLLPRDRTKETLASGQKGTRGRGETNVDCVRTLLRAAWASSHLIFSQHHTVGPVRIFFPFYR